MLQPRGGRAAGPADTLIGLDGRLSRIERYPVTLSRIALASIQAAQGQAGGRPAATAATIPAGSLTSSRAASTGSPGSAR